MVALWRQPCVAITRIPTPPLTPHTKVIHIRSIGTGGGGGHDAPDFRRGPNGIWPL